MGKSQTAQKRDVLEEKKGKRPKGDKHQNEKSRARMLKRKKGGKTRTD